MQGGHNAEAVLIVGTHATDIGHAAAHDLHGDSPAVSGHTRPPRSASNPVPTLTDAPRTRMAMNPTDYSLFRYIRECGRVRVEPAELSPGSGLPGAPTALPSPVQSSNASAPFLPA